MSNPRRSIAFLFLLVVLAPLSYALGETILERMIHHEMKEKLKTGQLVTLTVPEKEVVWMDKHEILYQGHMFDIGSRSLENGIYTFKGVFDKKETELVNKNRENHQQAPSDQGLFWVSLLGTSGLVNAVSLTEPVLFLVSDPYPSFDSFLPPSPLMDTLKPPPQTAVA